MPLVVKDRVRETSTTTGTGTFTLDGAVTGFQSFSVIGNGNTTYYTIALQGGNEWEVGIGTYTSSGTTLARNTVLESSNAGSLVNFSAGTKDVFVTYPAEQSVYVDGSNIVPATAATLPVASGGTGLSSLTANRIPYGNGTSAYQNSASLTFNGTTFSTAAASFSGVTSVTNTTASTLYTNGALVVSGGTGIAGRTTVNDIINRITGNGNSAWLQQDGTGRISWYWNTYGGTSPVFTNGSEDAAAISMSVTNTGAGGNFFVRSASGVGKIAGDAITWTTLLYADLNSFTYNGVEVVRTTTSQTLTNKTLSTGSTWQGNVVGAAYGGTGQSSYTVGDLLYASGTTALSKLAGVATGNVLLSGGVATAPSWGKVGLTTHVSGTLAIGNGGTGVTGTPTNGQLLIGNGSGYTLANLTAGSNISITNGAGSISIAATAAVGPLVENLDVVSTNYTVVSGRNAFSVGPMTINSGVVVTVSSGQRWVVI